MRLLVLMFLTIFYMETCSCSREFSVRPQVPEKYNYGSYSTSKPQNLKTKPNSTQILQTAAEVFESLGNASFQSFATTFQNINRKRLLTALKGVSIVARVISTQFDKEGRVYLLPNSNALANTVKENLEKLSEKAFSNRNFYFSSINNMTYNEALKFVKLAEEFNGSENDSIISDYVSYQRHFNAAVVTPVNRTSFWIIVYMQRNNFDNMDYFLMNHHEANMEHVISSVIKETPMLLGAKGNVSQFDKTTFEEYRGNITRYFLQAFIIQYFHISVGTESIAYSDEMEALDASFRIRHRQFMKHLKGNYLNNEMSFFPGTIKETVVRPVIDRMIGNYGASVDNCVITTEIVNSLNSAFPSRKYLVIVDDTKALKDHYAYSGFQKRMIIDDYRGKSVLVFMATKNATENRRSKYNGSELFNAVTMIKAGKDMKTALDIANNAENQYQMVAFDKDTYTKCYYRTEINIVDSSLTGYGAATVFIIL